MMCAADLQCAAVGCEGKCGAARHYIICGINGMGVGELISHEQVPIACGSDGNDSGCVGYYCHDG